MKILTPSEVFNHINILHKVGYEKNSYQDKEWVFKHKFFIEEEISITDLRIKWVYNYPMYSNLETEIPQIVISHDGYIMDGTHRAGSAKTKGLTKIKAFIGFL